MEEKLIYLFCDGSVNPQKKVGFASYLILNDINNVNEIKEEIKNKEFFDTSSTKLEVQGLLWALEDEKLKNHKVLIFTDCQNILGLKKREEGFLKNNYFSKTGKKIKNYLLYQEFYKKTLVLHCEFIKVKGHKKSKEKDSIDKIFSRVDKNARNALRVKLLEKT